MIYFYQAVVVRTVAENKTIAKEEYVSVKAPVAGTLN
jgi:hypothetical protein